MKYNASIVIDYNGINCCETTMTPIGRRLLNINTIKPEHVALAVILDNGDLLIMYYDITTINESDIMINTTKNEFGVSYPIRDTMILTDWSINQFDGLGKLERILTKQDFLRS